MFRLFVFAGYLHGFKRFSWNSLPFMVFFTLLVIYMGCLVVFGFAIVIVVIYIGFKLFS